MRFSAIVFAACLAASSFIHANDVTDGEALVKKSDCLSCHSPYHKVVGPAYLDVAKKYKGQSGALAKLVKKVKMGGSGNWGAVPMAAHPTLSDADLEKMVKWVLATPPSPAAAAPVNATNPTPAVHTDAPKADPGAPEKAAPKRKKKRHSMVPHGHEKAELAWETDEQVLSLMKAQDCFGCHMPVNRLGDPDEKPWPSFAKIQAKYKSSGPTEALVKKIHTGEGDLKWGKIPHPAYDHLPEEAVAASVKFITDGKYAAAAPVAADLSKMGAEEWMKTRADCFTCHAVSVKNVGPAYKDVAKKYAGANDALVKKLVLKVKQGGSGNWGTVPMAAHPTASDEQLEKAVRWVLAQK
jgi:cytochrome c